MRTRPILAASAALALGIACSDAKVAPGADAGPGDAGGGDPFELAVPCNDTVESLYGDPGPLDGKEPGAILKCARTPAMTRDAMLAEARALDDGSVPSPYRGKAFTSGAHTVRILYRTERGTSPPTPGYSVATVYVPDTPAAASLPTIVVAHGSRGQGPKCAMSLRDPAAKYVDGDVVANVYPFVGLGYALIAPDWAGYSNWGASGNPPSGYSMVADTGRSILDAARALRKLLPRGTSSKVALVGHSQGGHSALSALALAPTYGQGLDVAAVAVHAPLWLPQRSWAVLLGVEELYKLGTSSAVPASIWYHYTHGELLDGPGGGLLPFKESARPVIKDFMEQDCYLARWPRLEALGLVASAFFDPTFAESVRDVAAFGGPCPSDPVKKALCEKWMARYLADRPRLEGASANVPTLVTRGGLDTTIPADRYQCAHDVLARDLRALEVCYDPDADHSGIVRAHADYTVEWVASKTMGTPISATCPQRTYEPRTDAGTKIECAVPPPND